MSGLDAETSQTRLVPEDGYLVENKKPSGRSPSCRLAAESNFVGRTVRKLVEWRGL